jgi:predicted RNA binding protein YcfA (HicA-like mRNA interferase family)
MRINAHIIYLIRQIKKGAVLCLKVSELIRILKKNDCYLKRNGRSHDIWYSNKTRKQFSVPRHLSQDIPKGTYENIKKDAGF